MKTIVINLYGGPGTGKSTLAALIYHKLKVKGYKVELVQEYVKTWVYQNRIPNDWDQFEFFSQQLMKEHILYGKVQYIVTDCPLELSAYYADENKHLKPAFTAMLKAVESMRKDENVEVKRFFVRRDKKQKYHAEERFQTKEEALNIDRTMYQFMINNVVEFHYMHSNEIIEHLKL
jgi:cytidylate kinase